MSPSGPIQRKDRKTFYLCAWIAKEYELKGDVPTSISREACRAKAAEKTRLRCLVKECPLRPPAADGAAEAQGAPNATDQELQKDDLEAPGSLTL